MELLHRVAPFIPAFLRIRIMGVVYEIRRVKRATKFRTLKQLVALTKNDLLNDLRNLGLKEGDTILVHSSLTSLGYVEGGADTVIDALLEAVGSKGTILMPTYSPNGFLVDWVKTNPLFDPNNSSSQTGKITEVFRLRKGVLRSRHPTHSVAAIGHYAYYLLKDHEKSQTHCGKTSPFYKLIELNGYILTLGSKFGQVTSFHVIEDLIDNFPIKVYLKELVSLRYLDEKGIEHISVQKLNNPVMARTRIDVNKKKENEIYNYCLGRGFVRTGKVGKATCHLIEARGLEKVLEELLALGITIY